MRPSFVHLHIEFYRTARAAGVKPIIGCEVRVRGTGRGQAGRLFHLVLLARDRGGYENLVGLVSRSFLRAARSGANHPGNDDDHEVAPSKLSLLLSGHRFRQIL